MAPRIAKKVLSIIFWKRPKFPDCQTSCGSSVGERAFIPFKVGQDDLRGREISDYGLLVVKFETFPKSTFMDPAIEIYADHLIRRENFFLSNGNVEIESAETEPLPGHGLALKKELRCIGRPAIPADTLSENEKSIIVKEPPLTAFRGKIKDLPHKTTTDPHKFAKKPIETFQVFVADRGPLDFFLPQFHPVARFSTGPAFRLLGGFRYRSVTKVLVENFLLPIQGTISHLQLRLFRGNYTVLPPL